MNTKTRKDTIKNFHKFYDGIKLSQKCLSSYDCLYIFNLSLDCTLQKKGYLTFDACYNHVNMGLTKKY